MKNSGEIILTPNATGFTAEAINPTITLSAETIVNAMDVIGFQDQGREEVISLIQDKFQEFVFGNFDSIPLELLDLLEPITELIKILPH